MQCQGNRGCAQRPKATVVRDLNIAVFQRHAWRHHVRARHVFLQWRWSSVAKTDKSLGTVNLRALQAFNINILLHMCVSLKWSARTFCPVTVQVSPTDNKSLGSGAYLAVNRTFSSSPQRDQNAVADR